MMRLLAEFYTYCLGIVLYNINGSDSFSTVFIYQEAERFIGLKYSNNYIVAKTGKSTLTSGECGSKYMYIYLYMYI